jgi:hypothetical protein
VGLRAVPFLLSVADLLIGWLLLWHAEVALDAIDVATTQRDSAFYRGKVAAAVFFADTMLSRLAADRVVIESQGLAPNGTRRRGVLRAVAQFGKATGAPCRCNASRAQQILHSRFRGPAERLA